MTAKAILNILTLSQQITQGIYKDEDPLLQIPHFDSALIQKLKKKLSKKPEYGEFVKMTPEDKKKLEIFTENQLLDINAFCEYVPQLELKVVVQNADQIFSMDFIILDITLKNLNLKPEDEQAYVHSNTYPYLKKESIYLILTDGETERQIINT